MAIRTPPLEQLPLSLREAVPYIRYGGEVRPKRPLGQYELHATVEGYEVEIQAYFGTREPASAVLADAQGQLDRLVVSPEGELPAGGTPRAPARGEAVTLAFQRYYDAELYVLQGSLLRADLERQPQTSTSPS